MTHRKTNTDDEVIRSFRLPRAHDQALKEIAARDHRTFSSELRRLVAQRIAEEDQLEEAA